MRYYYYILHDDAIFDTTKTTYRRQQRNPANQIFLSSLFSGNRPRARARTATRDDVIDDDDDDDAAGGTFERERDVVREDQFSETTRDVRLRVSRPRRARARAWEGHVNAVSCSRVRVQKRRSKIEP